MRQITALMLLGAAIGNVAPLGAAGRVEPIQPRHSKVIEDTTMNHRQNLGRPLNPALPVNPLCVTCVDTEAFTAMVANAGRSGEGKRPADEASGCTSHNGGSVSVPSL